jgi:thiol:disulfide interchange protein
MNCVNHPDREAVAVCTYCGQFFCKDCLVPVKGKMVCKNDVDSVLNETTTGATKEAKMEAQMEALKTANTQRGEPIIINNNNNNSASSSAAASAAASGGDGMGEYYRYRRMHWLYFFVIGWWLGLTLMCCIIPLFIRGLVKKAFGYW